MTDAAAVIDRWLVALPEEATFERVRDDFWYVRLPGIARRWIPIEIEVGQRSVKLTSHVLIEPEERVDEVYAFLLRHNHRATGAYFSIDGTEGVICLVDRIALFEFDDARLDATVGAMVDETETTFRSILEIGFGSRLRRRSGG
jgi:hypothetical protein